jgi:predicted TIM-barrel fold metal-dependent hydrolase
LKIYKNLGFSVKDGDKLVRVDDPRLDPIWKKAGELGIPVLIHTADQSVFGNLSTVLMSVGSNLNCTQTESEMQAKNQMTLRGSNLLSNSIMFSRKILKLIL